MDKSTQLLRVLKAALKNEKYDEKRIDYDVLYADALAHSVHTAVYSAVRKQSDEWQNRKNDILLFSFGYMRMLDNALKLFSELLKNNIVAVAVKGLFLQNLYPSPDLRIMSDADIILKNRSDIDKVILFFRERGYNSKKTSDNVVNFFKDGELSFEVHLFAKLQRYTRSEGKSEMASEILDFTDTETVSLNGYEVAVFSPTLHYIYIIGHIGTHFCAGGCGVRQLCDAWLFAEKYIDEINWEEFWSAMKKLGYFSLAANIFYICGKEFSLDLNKIFCCVTEKPDDCSAELLVDMYESGVFGKKSKEQKYGRMVSAGGGSILHTLFPKYIEDEKYSYAMRRRILLPVAWIHRIFDFVIGKFSLKDLKYMTKSRKISKRRLNLFDKLGM